MRTSAMLSRQHALGLERFTGNRAAEKGNILERSGEPGMPQMDATAFQNQLNMETPKGLTAGSMNQQVTGGLRLGFLERVIFDVFDGSGSGEFSITRAISWAICSGLARVSLGIWGGTIE